MTFNITIFNLSLQYIKHSKTDKNNGNPESHDYPNSNKLKDLAWKLTHTHIAIHNLYAQETDERSYARSYTRVSVSFVNSPLQNSEKLNRNF